MDETAVPPPALPLAEIFVPHQHPGVKTFEQLTGIAVPSAPPLASPSAPPLTELPDEPETPPWTPAFVQVCPKRYLCRARASEVQCIYRDDLNCVRLLRLDGSSICSSRFTVGALEHVLNDNNIVNVDDSFAASPQFLKTIAEVRGDEDRGYWHHELLLSNKKTITVTTRSSVEAFVGYLEDALFE